MTSDAPVLVPAPQDVLPLPFDPMSESALTMAYRHTDFERRAITFEEACRDRGLLLALKNLAETLNRQLR